MAGLARVGRAEEHRFFTGLALAMLGLTVLGFSRTYLHVPQLGMPADTLPFTPLLHVHAAVAFGWCLLFVVQAWLVASGRTPQHRRLGVLGVALYVALVLLGPVVAINSVARYGSPPDELAFLAVSAGNIVAYTLLFGAALHWRRRPDVHKRLMPLGMVAMLTACGLQPSRGADGGQPLRHNPPHLLPRLTRMALRADDIGCNSSDPHSHGPPDSLPW